jgi:hypothetical protein
MGPVRWSTRAIAFLIFEYEIAQVLAKGCFLVHLLASGMDSKWVMGTYCDGRTEVVPTVTSFI